VTQARSRQMKQPLVPPTGDFEDRVRERYRFGYRTIRFPGHRCDRGDHLGRHILQIARPRGGRGGDRRLRIGIIIRPVGAFIFGNLADSRGRQEAMVYALVLMGLSTLAIGLTPTYDSIGSSHRCC